MEFIIILTGFNLKVQLYLIYFTHLKAGWVDKSLKSEVDELLKYEHSFICRIKLCFHFCLWSSGCLLVKFNVSQVSPEIRGVIFGSELVIKKGLQIPSIFPGTLTNSSSTVEIHWKMNFNILPLKYFHCSCF